MPGRSTQRYLVAACTLAVVALVCAAATPGVIAQENESTEREIDIQTERVNIYLYTEDRTIDHDERAVFVHSITNYITNDEPVTVQLILEAPRGSTVSQVASVEASTGNQFTTTTTLKPGEQESIRIQAELTEPGTHSVTGQVIYYFGNNRSTGSGVETTVPFEKRPPPPSSIDRVRTGAAELVGSVPAIYGGLVSAIEARIVSGGIASADQQLSTALSPVYIVVVVLSLGLGAVFSFTTQLALTPFLVLLFPNSDGTEIMELLLGVTVAISFIAFMLDFFGTIGTSSGASLLVPRYLAALTIGTAITGLISVGWLVVGQFFVKLLS